MDDRRTKSQPAILTRIPVYYGWIVLAVAFVTIAIGTNTRTAFSLLFPPILDEFGWGRGVTAGTFSIGFLTSMLISPFIGALMDRFGPNRVIPAGAVLVSAGLLLGTVATTPWQFYITLGALVVGGTALLSYIGHSFFLPFWFVRNRGLAIGIAFSGVGIGSIFFFPWLQTIIAAAGWREASWAMAIMLLVVLVPLNFLFQRRSPADLGLEPDGVRATPHAQSKASAADNVVDQAWVSTEWTVWLAMRTAPFWWLFFAYVTGFYAWYAVQVHQTKYLVDSGFSVQQAAFALGLVAFMGVVGQISIGHFSDRFGREWAWMISSLGFAFCYVLLLVMKSYPSLTLMYLMVAAQGLLGYGMSSIYGAMPAELFQGKRYGAIFGMFGVASGIGSSAGPWITGLIYDQSGDYTGAFYFALALSAVSIVCVWFAAPRKVRLVAGQAEKRARRQSKLSEPRPSVVQSS